MACWGLSFRCYLYLEPILHMIAGGKGANYAFGYVFSLGYYVIPVVAFIFYVLASLELVAEEIEEPFGGDANDLPTEQIAMNIQKHVGEII